MTNREDVANLNGILRKEMRNVHVESGRPLASAVAAIIASCERARFDRQPFAATRPPVQTLGLHP